MGIEKKDINEPEVSVGEILEDLEKKKKRYKKPEDLEKKKIDYPKLEDVENKSFKDLFIIWRKKVFTVPVLTMIGVWIIVYFQVTSHNHYGNGGTYKSISGSVSVRQIMSILFVEPISTRNWKNKNIDLVVERG